MKIKSSSRDLEMCFIAELTSFHVQNESKNLLMAKIKI